ncbi:DUF1501 domain-containing protein [Tropicibacter sp. R16_0]|uniref:DUF1501 domain-containing protein n=1 Tax=Tropicibacter sp. R16_0 TaxID=2821102 RepID=UPI001ADCF82E|nr:DUF1501 domain-containing protein [Tropicibacter sp. R16_0]MBO9449091.1 DUF1501 domain-containing protein [Tropicibacter sp. R16_0]
MTDTPTRRQVLNRALALGCSAAASPLLTPLSLAQTPGQNRLVVIILRGGMDAIDVIRPYGDPDYRLARPTLAAGSVRPDLDGFFGLHPAFQDLMPLWSKGELAFIQAVATPYRNKRSHFDGQDLLEGGLVTHDAAQGGWLNRAVQLVPGAEMQTAFGLGQGVQRVLVGSAPAAHWAPDADLSLSPQTLDRARRVMSEDPAFSQAFSQVVALSSGGANDEMPEQGKGPSHVNIARYAAEQMRGDTRVVTFSLNGWDTHRDQPRGLARAADRLTQAILTLRNELGDAVWDKTTIVTMSEFGRTVAENGSTGTDHGTGGAMILAGGAVRGGRVFGDWPGLAEVELFQGRDLMPTADVREMTGWVLKWALGLNTADLERQVFPGLQLGSDPGFLL